MATQSVSDRLPHLCGHWALRDQAGREARHRGPFTIAISREAGAGGTQVAQTIGSRLGWPVYDHELLDRIAQDMGIRPKLLEPIDERQTGWIKETLKSVFAVPMVSELAYVQRLVKTVHALGEKGECIIVGRGAPFILPGDATLRVRLVAPVAARIAALSRDLGLSQEDARRKVEAIDRERRDFVQAYFQKDPRDASYYDLVIDTARFSGQACAKLIVQALRDLQEPQTAKIL
jgi:cytidylate kinase